MTDLLTSKTVTFTDSELRALLKVPEAVQLVIDWHHCQEAEADAMDVPECVRYSESRRKVLEPYRDELLTARGDEPGEIGYSAPETPAPNKVWHCPGDPDSFEPQRSSEKAPEDKK